MCIRSIVTAVLVISLPNPVHPSPTVPLRRLEQWLRAEWRLYESPSLDPCMVRYAQLIARPCNASEVAVPAQCSPLWAHRVASSQNACADVPQATPDCGTNQTCWSLGACAALLGEEQDMVLTAFAVDECEASWTSPDQLIVTEDCVRWMAAYGCRNASTCSCLSVQRTDKKTYTTQPCVTFPRKWPRLDPVNAVLLVCVLAYSALQSRKSVVAGQQWTHRARAPTVGKSTRWRATELVGIV